jgi:isopentenyl-diphosphate delta-isomerase
VNPDPDEVAEYAWVSLGDLADAARTLPHLLSPWSVLQLAELANPLSPRP